MRNLYLISLVIIGAALTKPAYALGKLGHQLVCDLAYNQLAPAQQAAIDNILQQMPFAQKKRINEYNFDKATDKITLGKACTWPDIIKNQPEYKRYKDWHFINVDRSDSQVNKSRCQQNCITYAIPFHLQQFSQANTTNEQLEALMFFGHWLGDIHQPLHVGFASDLGGNKIKIKAKGLKCNNLHWLWDQCLLSWQTKRFKLQEQYSLLFTKLANITPAQHAQQKQWQNSTVIDWANESLTISRNPSNLYCQRQGTSCQISTKQPIFLTKEQRQEYSEKLNQRVQMASFRLAEQLKGML
ncbi:S1/P1 nuclease [Colwellia sp. MEBiC06753]